jgi:hypothetical protein
MDGKTLVLCPGARGCIVALLYAMNEVYGPTATAPLQAFAQVRTCLSLCILFYIRLDSQVLDNAVDPGFNSAAFTYPSDLLVMRRVRAYLQVTGPKMLIVT